MLTQGLNRTVQDCLDARENCRPSVFSNSDFYCTDVTLMGAWLWVLIMILPAFCLNILVLVTSLRNQICNVVSMWPPFLLSGKFSIFFFGPATNWAEFALSPILTGINVVTTLSQTCIALILLNKMKGKHIFIPLVIHIRRWK